MEFKTILLSDSGPVAMITLNRPDKRNAISFELIDEFQRALDSVSREDSQILIITGAGKAFSGGLDLENLKALTGRTHDQNIQDSRTMARLFRSIYDFPKPTIAAVNGPAIAGGMVYTMSGFQGAAQTGGNAVNVLLAFSVDGK